jgi:6-phosphofructokinase 1
MSGESRSVDFTIFSFSGDISGACMAKKRIGILTGGGDVPGLNAVIKGVVYRGSEIDCEVIGIRRGWEGLTHLNMEDPVSQMRYILPLNRENTRTIDRTGGTFLHTSRTNPSKIKGLPAHLEGKEFPKTESTKNGVTSVTFDVTSHVLKNIELLRFDYLIAIGGDDTLSYAAKLDKLGVPVVAIPKTMDNDVRNTEYCIGFSTAISRATDAIERQRTTVGSHERIGIFRVFGRDAGYTALYTAYVTSIRCCIPEYRFNLDKLIDLLVTDKKQNPSNYALVVLSEGAEWEGYKVREYGEPDAYGHRKKMSVAEDLSDQIKARVGEETVVSDLTYDLRSGSPDFVDKMVAITFGNMALDCIQQGKSGLMMAIVDGCYATVSIPDPKLGPRKVDVASMYNTERYRPSYVNKVGLPIFLTRA